MSTFTALPTLFSKHSFEIWVSQSSAKVFTKDKDRSTWTAEEAEKEVNTRNWDKETSKEKKNLNNDASWFVLMVTVSLITSKELLLFKSMRPEADSGLPAVTVFKTGH